MKKTKNKIIVISFIILIIMVSIFTTIFIKKERQKRAEEYKDLMVTVAKEIYALESKAVYHTSYITTTWYNAIFKERNSYTDKYAFPEDEYGYGVNMWVDFQTAINNYLSDNNAGLQELQNEELKIQAKLSELQNIPNEEYKNYLDIITEMYTNLSMLVSLANSPTGTYKEYGEKCNEYKEQFEIEYNKLLVMFPMIEEN